MQATLQVVESFRRARSLDALTTDDDQVTPVYKLDEFCALARESSADIVKELVDYLIQRLCSKSPYIKQKVLRLIKYSVGKAGSVFRREIQRHSEVVRGLVHFKGQLDPLKGDAPNKAVRELAQEAIHVMFNQEDARPLGGMQNRNKMEGFGSSGDGPSLDPSPKPTGSGTNGVMGFGSYDSFRQGLKQIEKTAQSLTSGYAGTGLQKSLTGSEFSQGEYSSYSGPEDSSSGLYSGINGGETNGYAGPGANSSSYPRDGSNTNGSSRSSNPWDSSPSTSQQMDQAPSGTTTAGQGSAQAQVDARFQGTKEDALVEKVATAGGVRVQLSREAIASFLGSASSMDGIVLGHALERRIKSHSWQIRLKALCALESLLRQKGSHTADTVFGFFAEDPSAIQECCNFQQTSLKDKARKILEILGWPSGAAPPDASHASAPAVAPVTPPAPPPPASLLPDLLDTTDPEPPSALPSGPAAASASAAASSSSDPFASLDFPAPGPAAAVAVVPAAEAPSAAPTSLLGGDLLDFPAHPAPPQTSVAAAVHPIVSSPANPVQRSPGPGTVPLAGDGMPNHHGPSGDLFTGLEVLSPSAAAAATAAAAPNAADLGLFQGLSLSDTKPTASASASGDKKTDILKAYQAPAAGVLPTPVPSFVPATVHPPYNPAVAAAFQQQQHLFLLQQQALAMSFAAQSGTVPGAPGFPTFVGAPGFPGAYFAPGMVPVPGLGGFGAPAAGGLAHAAGAAAPFQGGSGGTGYSDGFDFSGDPVPRHSTAPDPDAKEQTHAFDFVADHMHTLKGDKPKARS